MNFCERCGTSEGLYSFYHKKHYLCKGCTDEWIKYAGEKRRRNEFSGEVEGEKRFREFVRGLWSVS